MMSHFPAKEDSKTRKRKHNLLHEESSSSNTALKRMWQNLQQNSREEESNSGELQSSLSSCRNPHLKAEERRTLHTKIVANKQSVPMRIKESNAFQKGIIFSIHLNDRKLQNPSPLENVMQPEKRTDEETSKPHSPNRANPAEGYRGGEAGCGGGGNEEGEVEVEVESAAEVGGGEEGVRGSDEGECDGEEEEEGEEGEEGP